MMEVGWKEGRLVVNFETGLSYRVWIDDKNFLPLIYGSETREGCCFLLPLLFNIYITLKKRL